MRPTPRPAHDATGCTAVTTRRTPSRTPARGGGRARAGRAPGSRIPPPSARRLRSAAGGGSCPCPPAVPGAAHPLQRPRRIAAAEPRYGRRSSGVHRPPTGRIIPGAGPARHALIERRGQRSSARRAIDEARIQSSCAMATTVPRGALHRRFERRRATWRCSRWTPSSRSPRLARGGVARADPPAPGSLPRRRRAKLEGRLVVLLDDAAPPGRDPRSRVPAA